MEEAKVTGPMIIAMKGHPVTGKSTLARAIAEVLKCPIIEMDHIRNCIGIAQEPPLTAEAQNDHDLRCYTSLCAIAYAQLRLGFTIIIDSPLSLRSHLDLVHHLGTSTRGLGTSTRYPLVVIECKPQDVYEWQMRFERDLRVAKRVRSWYKPTTWEDLARLLELYEDYEIEGIEGIWKLVVDTTTYVNHVDLCRAIDYLVAQPNSLSVNLADWGGDGSRSIEPDQNRANDEGHTQRHVHIHKLVLFDSKDGKKLNNKDQVRCEGCLAAISDPIYYHCHGCGLSIHRLCAELPDKKELLAKGYPDFLKSLPKEYYSFSEQRRCATHCKDTFECSRCLFETNLRQALLPSVMDHKCHQHPLHLMLHPLSSKNEFRCQACGDLGHHALYNCSACEFECHVDCALLPHRCKNRHFRHTLTITPPSQSNYSTEEYCDACERYRNPNHWSYSSQQISNTSFTCHLNCCRTPWE